MRVFSGKERRMGKRRRVPATWGGQRATFQWGRKGVFQCGIGIIAKDLIVPNVTTTQRILVQAPVFLFVRTLLLSLRSQQTGRQRTTWVLSLVIPSSPSHS